MFVFDDDELEFDISALAVVVYPLTFKIKILVTILDKIIKEIAKQVAFVVLDPFPISYVLLLLYNNQCFSFHHQDINNNGK